MTSEFNPESLRILGLDDGEKSPQKIAGRVTSSSGTSESLLKILPLELMIAGPALITDNYKDEFAKLHSIVIQPESVEVAREICLKYFAPIFASNEFEQARILAASSVLKSSGASDTKQLPGVPATDIGSVQSFPLLAGSQPPYLPLLRVDILSSDDSQLMSETLTWADVLFCAMSMLGALAQHADGAAGLLKDNQIRLNPNENLKGLLDAIKAHATRIEGRLFDPEHRDKEQEANAPESPSKELSKSSTHTE